MQPRLLSNWNKVRISSLTCFYIEQVTFCQIYQMSDMFRILGEALNHYTVVYGLNCRMLMTVLWDTGACNGKWWKIPSVILTILVLGIKELNAIAEPNSTPQKHHQSLRSKPQGNQDHATNLEDPTSKATAETLSEITVTNKQTHSTITAKLQGKQLHI